MKKYTLDDLRLMTPEQRAVLYQNAQKHRANGGEEIIKLIDSSGLPLSSGGMRTTDSEYIKMEEIVWSATGRQAAIEVSEKGLPALAGVEPMIVQALGPRYHPHDGGTVNAGYIVAGLMRHMDYVENGEGKMPAGSVAKTAMRWKPRKQ
jgi:hypothetical protein